MKDLYIPETTYVLVRQIGLALGHSLWIGAVAALIAAVVVVCTRRNRPEVRYNLLTGLLLLFIVATGIVFVQTGPAASGMTPRVFPATEVVSEVPVSVDAPSYRQSAMQVAADFFARNIYFITMAWLVVVLAKFTGLAIGIYRLHRLKTRQIYSMGGYWEQRVSKFAKAMGIMRPVRVFQSGLVKVPTVLGHFKPVILVPLGVITSIPADQIEMVLLHELAHIRRFDFLINFLQQVTELLFFFNPGILWISRLIREERENCCDDIALSHSGNEVVYIRALLSFREYQLNGDVYQLAFSGKGGLLQRAKRIASRTNSTLGAAERTVLLVATLAFLTFSILFAQSGGRHSGGRQSAARQSVPQTTTRKTDIKQAQGSGHNNVSATSGRQQPYARTIRNNPDNIDNQHTNNSNVKNDVGAYHAYGENPALADTLRPLQKTMAPLYKSATPVYTDSSGGARLAPTLRQPYAPTYKMQPLQTYNAYEPDLTRIRRQTINEKIMDEIERQGIVISRNNIDFRITNKELTVNGARQPEAVHKAVLNAVLTGPNDVIDFTYGRHQ